jgi:hypothetical protein
MKGIPSIRELLGLGRYPVPSYGWGGSVDIIRWVCVGCEVGGGGMFCGG